MGDLIKLHAYQKACVLFALKKGCVAWFADPGMGKTSMLLSLIKILKQRGKLKKALIIAPLRVAAITWPDEIKKWRQFSSLSISVLHGKHKNKHLTDDADIHVINPEGLAWLFSKKNKPEYQLLGLDESSMFKNWSSKRLKLLKKYLHCFDRRVILTGTPTPKSLLDLFAQIYIVDMGESLGSAITHYRRKYFRPDYMGFSWDVAPGAESKIYQAIAPISYRLDASKHLKLPDLTINDIPVDLPTAAMVVYREMWNKLFAEVNSTGILAVSRGVAYFKCGQIADGVVYNTVITVDTDTGVEHKWGDPHHVHDAKINALRELVSSLQGAPLLVGYRLQSERDAIRKALGAVPCISGATSRKDTVNIVNQWNNGEIPVLLGQPAAMGHGLNMQKVGRHICWYSIPDDYDKYHQFNCRVYRQGVSGSVIIHRIVARKTVDEIKIERLGKKETGQKKLLDAILQYREK